MFTSFLKKPTLIAMGQKEKLKEKVEAVEVVKEPKHIKKEELRIDSKENSFD